MRWLALLGLAGCVPAGLSTDLGNTHPTQLSLYRGPEDTPETLSARAQGYCPGRQVEPGDVLQVRDVEIHRFTCH